MAPGIAGNVEEQFQRQMGCMTGFLQIFDRHQIIAGKRFYSAKRLQSSSTAGSTSPSERSEFSSLSLAKAALKYPSSPSVEGCLSSPEDHTPVSSPGRHTLPLPVFELKDGLKTSWKLREAPRLSLDSRAVVDVKGRLRPREIRTVWNLSEASEEGEKQRRSPSVVARLMGLEALPVSGNEELLKRSELRRSASESCFPRDLSHFNFQKPFPVPPEESFAPPKQAKPEVPRPPPTPPTPPLLRKSFFDAQEFFPEPRRAGSIYGEIEKRLRMRGIEEPAKDLETLKQILESLQFKGLLHSKLPERRPRNSAPGQSPIVVMKPAPNPPPPPLSRSRSTSPLRSPSPESTPPARARRDREKIERNLRRPVCRSLRSPAPNEALRSPSCGSPARRRPLNAEGQKASLPQRRIAAVHSSRTAPQSIGLDQMGARSSKNRRPTVEIPPKEKVYSPAEEDTSATVSDSSIISSGSQFDFESARVEEHRNGRRLLERCDKLLHSIAAITSSAEQVTATDRQPSPVSVLDASTLLSDEIFASPTPKRAIDFQDQLADWDDHHWNKQATSTAGSKSSAGSQEETEEAAGYHGEDYAYVADVLREMDHHCNAAEAFAAVEKRHSSAVSRSIHRRLFFDTVTELLDRKGSLSPWDAFSCAAHFLPAVRDGSGGISLMGEVWEELQLIQERVVAVDVMDVIGGAISKDMAAATAGERSWAGAVGTEMSEAVLHIERQVFKDLVADTIRELADLVGRCRPNAFRRRRLLF